MTAELTAEKYPSLVAGIFDDEMAGKQAINDLITAGQFKPDAIDLVSPQDAILDRKIEPEARGIKRTLFRAHLQAGVFALLIGLILAVMLVTVGPQATQASPVVTIIAVCIVAVFLGLMFAGVVTLRPDHDAVTMKVKSAAKKGRWSVVVHTQGAEQNKAAARILKPRAVHFAQSL